MASDLPLGDTSGSDDATLVRPVAPSWAPELQIILDDGFDAPVLRQPFAGYQNPNGTIHRTVHCPHIDDVFARATAISFETTNKVCRSCLKYPDAFAAYVSAADEIGSFEQSLVTKQESRARAGGSFCSDTLAWCSMIRGRFATIYDHLRWAHVDAASHAVIDARITALVAQIDEIEAGATVPAMSFHDLAVVYLHRWPDGPIPSDERLGAFGRRWNRAIRELRSAWAHAATRHQGQLAFPDNEAWFDPEHRDSSRAYIRVPDAIDLPAIPLELLSELLAPYIGAGSKMESLRGDLDLGSAIVDAVVAAHAVVAV